jgi:ribosome modulation factor
MDDFSDAALLSVDAFKQGRSAQYEGKSLSYCPYPKDHDLHEDWKDGWEQSNDTN